MNASGLWGRDKSRLGLRIETEMREDGGWRVESGETAWSGAPTGVSKWVWLWVSWSRTKEISS